MHMLGVVPAVSVQLLLVCGSVFASTRPVEATEVCDADVCVYGGTASGMMAAVAAAQRGHRVIVVEPSRWLGGMIGGGIRVLRDCAYPQEIGGLTRGMMQVDRVIGGGNHDGQSALRAHFRKLARENDIHVIYEHRLGRVVKQDHRIQTLLLDYAPPDADGCPAPGATTPKAIRITARVFIDASYEGDLMAQAGVSYVVGRESIAEYGESLAGVRNLQVFDISPYVRADDPESGLLPMIDPGPIGEMGSASRHINAYNFRLQWVDDGAPVGQPGGDHSDGYALVRRALAKKRGGVSWPHANTDRHAMISGGIPGRQSDYPDADWPTRAKIWREWIDHVKIMHQLTGAGQRLKTGEYPQTHDFPHQLYIRLARRMRGRYVMTQHDLMLQTTIEDPVGLAYYRVDIYPVRLVATPNGKVASEGETFERVSPGPYPIAYRALTPNQDQCSNLLVPVCLSASHVALSSIRMEPTFMIIGEAAGIAASCAIEEQTSVQQIDPAAYRAKLLAAGLILQWDGTGYGNSHSGWWTDHPQDYARRPVETIFKGKRWPGWVAVVGWVLVGLLMIGLLRVWRRVRRM